MKKYAYVWYGVCVLSMLVGVLDWKFNFLSPQRENGLGFMIISSFFFARETALRNELRKETYNFGAFLRFLNKLEEARIPQTISARALAISHLEGRISLTESDYSGFDEKFRRFFENWKAWEESLRPK